MGCLYANLTFQAASHPVQKYILFDFIPGGHKIKAETIHPAVSLAVSVSQHSHDGASVVMTACQSLATPIHPRVRGGGQANKAKWCHVCSGNNDECMNSD